MIYQIEYIDAQGISANCSVSAIIIFFYDLDFIFAKGLGQISSAVK